VTPKSRVNEKDGGVLIWIPGGEFVMGGSEFSSERPPHRVRLSLYWIGRTEVTNAMYRRFIDETGHPPTTLASEERFGAPEQPVVGVDWADAAAYCAWAGGRLPTEAEWEFAARGTDGRRYPWGTDEPEPGRAVFDRDFLKGVAAAVGTTPGDVSPFGVLDMAGNVTEWCADWAAPYPADGPEPLLDPKGPPTGTLRVRRGGSYMSTGLGLRVTERYLTPPVPLLNRRYIGFRLAVPDSS
jgi:formylglycine-generating enzyme required for sulfatase activity